MRMLRPSSKTNSLRLHDDLPYRAAQTWGFLAVAASLLFLGCQQALPTEGEGVIATQLTWNLGSGAVIGLGSSVQLQATARDADGRPVSSYTITWESSDPSVLSADGDGSLTAMDMGSATIRASGKEFKGNTGRGKDTAPGQLKKEADVVVDDVQVSSVEVTPSQATTTLGGTVRMSAITRDGDGNELTDRIVSWSSSNASVASVDEQGLVFGEGDGTATITATSEGQSGTATVEVVADDPAGVASVEIVPSAATVEVGSDIQLSVIIRDGDGNELTDREASWSSSNTSVATVDGTGLVSGRATGTATITATSEGQSGRASVTVFETDGILAFPGAEGFGRLARGGRGGQVFVVSNLNDGGAGSLRECVEASGPRTCVFSVAGTITLNSNLDIENPYITIAGQTAPGGGITLKSASATSSVHLRVETHDVIVRYIRSRPGTSAENARALTVSNSGSAPYNVIIDHVSMSWAGDEIFISWYDTNNITVQWSSMSESLPYADGGYKGPNLGDGGGSGWLSFHHNLIAHHNQRFPLTRTGEGPIDLVNNVMYNLGTYGHANLRETTKANLVNNYVKPGPNSTISTFVRDSEISGGGYYHSGNVVEAGWSVDNFASNDHRVSSRYSAPPITTTSAEQAFEDVLAASGAIHGLTCDGTWFNRPDAVDVRIVESVRNGTRGHSIPRDQTVQQLGFISDPSDVGGWPQLEPGTSCADADSDGMPDVWEQANGLDPNVDDSAGDVDGDGYTNLEEFLNGTSP